MTVRDRNPFDEIEKFFERMSDQFEETAEWPMRMRRDAAVDVLDTGEAFEVRVDLPGFQKEDITLTLAEGTLRVHAEREAEAEAPEEGHYVRQERASGPVDRRVGLRKPVDEESVDATLADGVLSVTLTKEVAEDDAKTIDIE